MDRRTLGNQGLEVSALGLGCMGMSEFYGTTDEGEAIATIHRALELGIDFLDTADMYGRGANEKLVGKAIARPARRGRARHEVRQRSERRRLTRRSAATPEYVRQACDASLQRLGLDHVDLYYQHRVDRRVPIEETVGAMAELVRSGQGAAPRPLRSLVRDDPARARRASDRGAADGVLPLDARPGGRCARRPAASSGSASSPTARSAAASSTGQIRSPDGFAEGDFRGHLPRFQGENLERNLRARGAGRGDRGGEGQHAGPARARVGAVARRRRRPDPGHEATALSRGERQGGRRRAHDEDLERLEEAFPQGAAAGDRYPDMSTIDR